jgi:uncharacterized protein
MPTLTMHALSVGTFVPMLESLTHLLGKAEEAADAKRIDLATLPDARLAPDMFPFRRQVQFACYQATSAVLQLSGEAAPPLAVKDDATFDDLKALLAGALRELEAASASKLDGSEDRTIHMPLVGPMYIEGTGLQFLREWALPHFYFHLVTAYDILRHSGADVGKRDYMAHAGPLIRGRS